MSGPTPCSKFDDTTHVTVRMGPYCLLRRPGRNHTTHDEGEVGRGSRVRQSVDVSDEGRRTDTRTGDK